MESPRVGSPTTSCHCSTGAADEDGFAAGVEDLADFVDGSVQAECGEA